MKLSACALVFAAACGASADEFVVTFEKTNVGHWSYFGDPSNPVEVIEPDGGNPGAFLHCTCDGLACLDTFAPQFRTEAGTESPFTGDYRAMSVTSLGVDLILFDVDFSAEGRPLTLMLRTDNGTPDDFGDDTTVYVVGPENIPLVGEGWKEFDFDVPSQSDVLPADWKVTLDSNLQGDAAWNAVIEDVDQVVYFYGDPEFFFIFQQWEPGADNPRITTAGCEADFNGDGELNILDFVAFQEAFAAGDDSADCNGDADLNILDFICFQEVFQAGCQ